MPEALCASFYQKTKKRLKKNPMKGIKILMKKKKTENENMVVNDIRISRKLKNKD